MASAADRNPFASEDDEDAHNPFAEDNSDAGNPFASPPPSVVAANRQKPPPPPPPLDIIGAIDIFGGQEGARRCVGDLWISEAGR